MRKVVHNLSMFTAIRGTRLVCIIGLLINFIVQLYYHYAVTALVIVLCYIVLPALLESVVQRWCKCEEASVLEELQKCYRFSKVHLGSQVIAYGILLLLLGVWQYANCNSTIAYLILKYYPCLLFAASVIVCIGLYLYNRIKIPYLVKNNLV